MNTPEGLIWFTPGIMPGYTAGMVYVPGLNVYLAYTTNRSPLPKFHAHLIMSILHVINNNSEYKLFLKEYVDIPEYCSKIIPAKQFVFPFQ
jgi:D-alanyl-D-alanine carboxypeptidase